MKNVDKIKSKSIDEFAKWLDKYCSFEDSPWVSWWNDKYCNNCPSEIGKFEDSDREVEFAWCELHDKCRFFQDMDCVPNSVQMVKMWLESEED